MMWSRLIKACWVFCMVCGWSLEAAAQDAPPPPPPAPAPADAKPAPQDDDFQPPKLLRSARPDYPADAKAAGLQGSVVVLLDIDEAGKVTAVEVLKAPEPDLGLIKAATDAARKMVFKPATEGGQPVPVQLKYRFRFVLDGDPAPASPPKVPIAPESKPEPPPPPKTQAPLPPVNFKGRVLERGVGDPIAGATVLIFRGQGAEAVGFEAVTDENGEFSFRALEAGAWRVLVESAEHYPSRTTEEIKAGLRLELTYRLERTSYNTFDVLVEGERGKARVTRRTVGIEESELMPGILGDPLKVIRALPGVAQTSLISPDIVIRGGAPQDTRIFAFDLEIPAVFHFGGIRGIFPGGMVDAITLYPGNFPVTYGRSIGGVIDIDIPIKDPETWHGHLDVSLLDSSFYLEFPVTEDVWMAFSARRSYLDTVIGVVGLVTDDDLVLPRYFDVHAQVGWRPNLQHALRFFVFTADDDFVVYSVNDEPDFEEDTLPELSLIQAGARHVWTPSEETTLTSAFSIGAVRQQRLADGLQAFFPAGVGLTRERTLRLAGRSHLEQRIEPNTMLIAGLDTIWTRSRYRLEADLFDLLEPEADPSLLDNIDLDGNGVPDLEELLVSGRVANGTEVGAYMAWELTHFDDLLVVPAARVDHYSTIDQTAFSPRLNVTATPWDQWEIKGAIGRFNQPPIPFNLDELLGNPALTHEVATQTELGAAWSPNEFWRLEVTGFYKDLDRLVEPIVEPVLDLLLRPSYDNIGRGRAYGAEVYIRYRFFEKFSGWLAYTLSRTERFNQERQRFEVFDFDQTHNLTWFGSYRFPLNWSAGVRFRYATGFPFYDEFERFIPVGRGTDFHQLDLRLDKRWIYTRWSLNVYFDLQNVYNRFNFSSPGGVPSSASSVPPPGLPLLPILGARANF